MKEVYKKMIYVVLAVFSTIAININLQKEISIVTYNNGNSIITIFFAIFLVISIKKCFEIKDKRLHIITTIVAFIFATCEILGQSINQYLDLSAIYNSKTNIIISIIMIIGYTIIIKVLLTLIFTKLNNIVIKDKENKKGTIYFFVSWIIIVLAWIPYFLTYFPGNITPDSVGQIDQVAGISTYNNHHPFFHTIIIGIAIKLGLIMKGNYNTGIAIYSIAQMIALSGIFAFSIYYMIRKKVPKVYTIMILIFYAIYPVNALYSITMWKDIPFAGCMLLFTVCMIEFASNKDNLFKYKIRTLIFILSFIFIILFRNNGIYVVLLSLPFLFIFGKKYWKKLLLITIIIIGFYAIYNGVALKVLNVKEGSKREALSIPLQQFARVSNEEDLTQEEKDIIYKYLPVENLGQRYTPKISDPVKNYFDNDAFKNNKFGILKLYFHFSIKYPIETLESFLCNSYGYYYPEAIHWVVAREVYQTDNEVEKELNLRQNSKINGKYIKEIDSLIDRRDIPILSMMFSIGFIFWIIFTNFIYMIYKKKYNVIVVYIPILMLWLTTLASPVYAEFRYVYSMFTCLGILISMIFIKDDTNN